MPTYTYKSLRNEDDIYELRQSIHDEPYTQHPENGDQIKRIINSAAFIRLPGIKKSTKVDKRSPAATACGCASQAVLKSLGMEKTTPRYSASKKQVHSHSKHSSHQHSGHCCSSKH